MLLPPTATTHPTAPPAPAPPALHDVLADVGEAVAALDLDDARTWTAVSATLTVLAATLRAACAAIDDTDPTPVPATAAPIVRVREVGHLAARLAAILPSVHPDADDLAGDLTARVAAVRTAAAPRVVASAPRRRRRRPALRWSTAS